MISFSINFRMESSFLTYTSIIFMPDSIFFCSH